MVLVKPGGEWEWEQEIAQKLGQLRDRVQSEILSCACIASYNFAYPGAFKGFSIYLNLVLDHTIIFLFVVVFPPP